MTWPSLWFSIVSTVPFDTRFPGSPEDVAEPFNLGNIVDVSTFVQPWDSLLLAKTEPGEQEYSERNAGKEDGGCGSVFQ